jgi:hypothetical protein
VIPVARTVNKQPPIGHFSRASAHAGFGFGERTIVPNGRTDDVTEMMSRSRSAPPRQTPTAATPAIASITIDLRVQRERGENLRAARPIGRANPIPPREAMVDFGMST